MKLCKFRLWMLIFVHHISRTFCTSEARQPSFLEKLLTNRLNDLWDKLTSFGSDSLTARIVGGQVARSGEFPYMVALKSRTGKLLCGGSLIHARYVLTAAHCVKGVNPSILRVVVGTRQLSDEYSAAIRGVSRVFAHPGFDFDAFDWDVAVLELLTPVSLSARIQPICLKTTETPRLTRRRATVIGWGRRKEDDQRSSDSLRKVNVPVINSKVCQRAYRLFRAISDRMLCAGFRRGGRDSCQGDSGGPMVIKSGDKIAQVGIVSWGNGCARPGYYGVYTRIVKVLAWIRAITPIQECT